MLRKVTLVFGIAVVFGLVTVVLANVMPSPLRQTEYMIIGAVSTLVRCLYVSCADSDNDESAGLVLQEAHQEVNLAQWMGRTSTRLYVARVS